MKLAISMRLRRLRDIFARLGDQHLHAAGKDCERVVRSDPLGKFLREVCQVGGDRGEDGIQCWLDRSGGRASEGNREQPEGFAEHDELGLADHELRLSRNLHRIYSAWCREADQTPGFDIPQASGGRA